MKRYVCIKHMDALNVNIIKSFMVKPLSVWGKDNNTSLFYRNHVVLKSVGGNAKIRITRDELKNNFSRLYYEEFYKTKLGMWILNFKEKYRFGGKKGTKKMYKKSTLMSINKDDLSEMYIELQRNFGVIHELLDRQTEAIKEKYSWIPVSERLPEDQSVVMISFIWKSVPKKHEVSIASYDALMKIWNMDGECAIGYRSDTYIPLAWMELPEPYKEDTNV